MGDRSELKIFINFSKDGTTLARMVKFLPNCGTKELKRGIAKCHPDDKFDPQIGAMIALARMFGDEVEFHANEEKPKEKPERKLTDAEKKALEKGYTLVRDRLPSCTAYDGKYTVMTVEGCEGANLYWSHKYKTFTVRDLDNSTVTKDDDGKEAYRVWMSGKHGLPVVAWKVQPDKVEQKALDEGYTLCRDRYPDKSGQYDLITEHGGHWKDFPWSSRWQCFGESDDHTSDKFGGRAAWMNKHDNPAIAWKDHK